MKILHIFDHSIPLHSGYTFRSLAILQQQRAMGWQTCHITSAKHQLASPENRHMEEDIDGLHFYRTQPHDTIMARFPVLNQWAIVKGLSRRLAELIPIERPDILHAHSPALNGLAAIEAGRAFNIPVVYECRAFWEDAAVDHGTSREGGLRYRLTRALETHVFRQADAVTTICEGLRGDILARGLPDEKVTVIPNAVDLDAFSRKVDPDDKLIHELGLQDRIVLGFIGSFYAYEGLDLLLSSLPLINQNIENITVLLIGGGPEEARLKDRAKQLGITAQVHFIGRVPHDEVARYYQLVDIFIYPRHPMRLTELVTPLKPLEAMAQDKLVIASDVGGHRELIADGHNGRLFKAGSKASLAAVISELASAEDSWPGLRGNGRQYVELERNWKKSVAHYQPVYDRLTQSHQYT